MKSFRSVTGLFFGLALLFGVGGAKADAHEGFRKEHPRRAEVNRRIRHQERRVRKEVRRGKISQAQGAQLLAKDRSIKAEERSDVKANGGHLSQGQQAQLNQELNANH